MSSFTDTMGHYQDGDYDLVLEPTSVIELSDDRNAVVGIHVDHPGKVVFFYDPDVIETASKQVITRGPVMLMSAIKAAELWSGLGLTIQHILEYSDEDEDVDVEVDGD